MFGSKLVLQCEDTPQGIFSAVYEAWELKLDLNTVSLQAVNDRNNHNLELFAEYKQVTTNQEKAKKVMNTLQTRYSQKTMEEIYYIACSAAADKGEVIFQCIRALLRMGKRATMQLSNPYMLRAMELFRNVANERHHFLGFLRFMESSQNILIGRMQPQNNITELLMPHFAERFPQERFIIWDVERNLAGIHEQGDEYWILFLSAEQERHLAQVCSHKDGSEDLWRIFLEGISIRERENRKLQQSNLPLRFRTYMTEFETE